VLLRRASYVDVSEVVHEFSLSDVQHCTPVSLKVMISSQLGVSPESLELEIGGSNLPANCTVLDFFEPGADMLEITFKKAAPKSMLGRMRSFAKEWVDITIDVLENTYS